MPNWQPNWEDVEFDHAKAQAAIAECNNSARGLDSALAGLATEATTLDANGAWTGRYRTDFDAARPVVEHDGVATRTALLDLARAIATAAAQATTEQAGRVADRERWRQEKAQEDAQRPSGGGRIPE